MKRSRFTESQIVNILNEQNAGFGVDDILNTTELIDSEGNVDYNRIQLFSAARQATRGCSPTPFATHCRRKTAIISECAKTPIHNPTFYL